MSKKIDSLEILRQCQRNLAQTEDVGSNILTELSVQREKLEKTKSNTKEIKAEQSASLSLLRKMSKWWR